MRLQRPSRVRSSRGHVRVEQGSPWTRWAAWGAAVIAALVVGIVVIRQVIVPALENDETPKDNRTWLEFAWTNTPINGDAVQQLGKRLESNGIRMVYLEAAAWRSDNTLAEGQYTADFAQALRNAYPTLKILLWLRMSGEQIDKPELRTMALDLAGRAVRDWKLDGVQLNGRAVVNGNESYIQLLRDLRKTIDSGTVLSVTVPPDRIPIDPDVPLGPPSDPALTWDVNYKQRVGLLSVDEMVIMAHASGLEDAKQYEVWVAYQAESYVSALGELEQPVGIIVAVPTYDAAPNHDPGVEGVRAAIVGVQAGIKKAGEMGKRIKGVGLYEYKTTDSLEWELYRQGWLEAGSK